MESVVRILEMRSRDSKLGKIEARREIWSSLTKKFLRFINIWTN